MHDDLPDLLLVDADRHTPALARGAEPATLRRQPVPPGPRPDVLWNDNERPNDLAEQRWSVIAPEGADGDALLAAIAPLVEARAAEQGRPVKVFRVRPRMTAAEAARWKREVFLPSERLRRDLPRYQLVLGDLHQVSEELQVSQSTDGFVGRLAFDDPTGYAAYVAKLLAAERAPPPPRRAVFYAVRDGTPATDAGHRGLVRPCAALARELHAGRPAEFPAEVVHDDDPEPSPEAFLELARDPGVMLSLSHGEGAPRGGWRSPAEQRARQGSMSFGSPGDQLGADRLATGELLPGGAWLMFACFGAGTPQTSKYRPWLELLAQQGRSYGRPEAALESLPPAGAPPFVGAVPKAARANPRGPVAFIGHVDLAWTYSFREVDTPRPLQQSTRFLELVAALVRGDRAGVAFRELFRYFEQTNTELTALDVEPDPDPVRRAHLWMLRQDLAGYMLLGDPAARAAAPRSEVRPATPERAPQDRAAALLGVPVAAPQGRAAALPGVPVAAPPRPDLARLERAIGYILSGSLSLARAAADCGLAPAELGELVERYRRGGRQAIDRSDG
jgi:hypothetical protein